MEGVEEEEEGELSRCSSNASSTVCSSFDLGDRPLWLEIEEIASGRWLHAIFSRNNSSTSSAAEERPSVFSSLTRRRQRRQKNVREDDTLRLGGPQTLDRVQLQPDEVPQIHLVELKEITGNFGGDALIDQGFYGEVYRGVLRNRGPVAIKRFGMKLSPSELLKQVSVAKRLKHENVNATIGYYFDDKERILVYDYATLGSLYDVLHGQGPILSWTERVKIAVGAAKGLEYLQEKGCANQIPITRVYSARIVILLSSLQRLPERANKALRVMSTALGF